MGKVADGEMAIARAVTIKEIDRHTKSIEKHTKQINKQQTEMKKLIKESAILKSQLDALWDDDDDDDDPGKGQPEKIANLVKRKDLTMQIIDAQMSYSKTVQDSRRELSYLIDKNKQLLYSIQTNEYMQTHIREQLEQQIKLYQKGNLSAQKRREIQNKIIDLQNELQQLQLARIQNAQTEYKVLQDILKVKEKIQLGQMVEL